MTEYVFAETAGAPGGPLVFTFHGTGATERQLHDAAAGLVPGAHVVSPRGDVDEAGALRFFRRRAEGVYDMEDLARRRDAMAAFLRAKRDEIGAGHVIALGYSNGANIAAAVAMTAPDIFDELALLHPLIPWQPTPQPGLAGRRVLVTAGERDPICPPDETRRLIRWFTEQGARVSETWHPGGHEIAAPEVEALRRFLTRETT